MAFHPLVSSDGELPGGPSPSVPLFERQVLNAEVSRNVRPGHGFGNPSTNLTDDAPLAPVPSHEGDETARRTPETAIEAARGARSGAELLRRISLVDSTHPDASVWDPRAAHPGLQLTGRIISAAFCIPYKLGFHPEADWVWNL